MLYKGFLIVQICFLLLVALTKSLELREEKSTAFPPVHTSVKERSQNRLDSGDSLHKNRELSPGQSEGENDGEGFIEVNEKDIPEGATVYVLEEPLDAPVDGETLKTANNIVFRPLFRYRGKQEAQRRNSNRFRRRYFMPRRSYRQTYHFPYYYHHYSY